MPWKRILPVIFHQKESQMRCNKCCFSKENIWQNITQEDTRDSGSKRPLQHVRYILDVCHLDHMWSHRAWAGLMMIPLKVGFYNLKITRKKGAVKWRLKFWFLSHHDCFFGGGKSFQNGFLNKWLRFKQILDNLKRCIWDCKPQIYVFLIPWKSKSTIEKPRFSPKTMCPSGSKPIENIGRISPSPTMFF